MKLARKPSQLFALYCVAAIPSGASPAPLHDITLAAGSVDTELLIREGIAQSRDIEKRIEASFSLDRSWDHEVLFGGAWSENNTQSGVSSDGSGLTSSVTTSVAAHEKLSVTCLECHTSGTVTAKLDDSDFFKPALRLEFTGVEAYAFLGIEVDASQTFSLTLFASESPLGLGVPGLDVGVVFFVDLVFAISEAVDLTAGFEVRVPDGSFLEADIFGGDVGDSLFDGLSSQSLPVTVYSGSATFKADLRLRVQCGAETELGFLGIGAGAVVGIYANIIEFVAVIESTPACPLETELWWDLNVGAYAHLDVVVDYTTLGPVPTVSTTLLAASTISTCLIEATATPTITTSGTTIASATATPTPSTAATSGSTFSVSSYSSESTFTVSSYHSSESTFGVSSYDDSSTVLSESTFSASSYDSTSSSYPTQTGITVGGIIPALTTTAASASAPLVTSAPVPYPVQSPNLSPKYPVHSSAVTYTTSTYTHTITRCGAPGVINCPADYQTTVVATRTTTYPGLSSSSSSSLPPAKSLPTNTITKVILTTLPTPAKSTFASPAAASPSPASPISIAQAQKVNSNNVNDIGGPVVVTETATVSPVLAIAVVPSSSSTTPSHHVSSNGTYVTSSSVYAPSYPTPKSTPAAMSNNNYTTTPTQTPLPVGSAGRIGAVSVSALMVLGVVFVVFCAL